MNTSVNLTRSKLRVLVLALVAIILSTSYWMPRGVHAAAGDLDLTFGMGGKVITPMSQGSANDEARGVTLQNDGKTVAVGSASGGATGLDFALARYNTDGSLDTTFGTGGKVLTNLSDVDSEDIAYAAAVLADGKILVVGLSYNRFTAGDFALARYNADGSLDSTFGTGGKVTTNVGFHDRAVAMAIQPDGKIIAAGYSNNFTAGDDFALVRYNADGSLDTTFGNGGKVVLNMSTLNANDNINALGLQQDGRIVAAGMANNSGTGYDFALARFNSDGSLDTTFGTGGKVSTNISNVNGDDYGNAMVIQPDGRIVVAGGAANSGTAFDFALVRYNPDGSLDTSFGTGGKVTTDIGGHDEAYAMVLQRGGRIAVAGYWAAGFDFALARYNADGSLDTSFGTGGKLTANMSPVNSTDQAYALALQPDDRLIAAGNAWNGTDYDFAVARFDARPPNTAPTLSGVPSSTSVDELTTLSFTATATDPDAPPQTLTYSLTGAPAGATIDPTTGQFSWTPSESQGCSRYSFSVNVTDGLAITRSAITVTVNDTQSPVITCPANVTHGTDPNQCGAVVTYTTPTVSDNCSGVGTPVCSPASGSTFPAGVTTVSCSVSDASGNTANCSFTVNVQDTQPPVITCPPSIRVPASAGACSATVSYPITVSDNCPGATVVAAPPSNSPFPIGVTTVTATARDASGNTSTCSFTVTVVDEQPPQINCPAAVNVNAAAGACSAIVSYSTPSASDNCSGASVTCSPPSGSTFPIGTTTVGCTATDAAGNSSSCGFEVRVAQPVTISSNFNGTAITAGNTIWFNSVLKPQGLGASPVTIRVVGQKITSSNFSLDVPDSVITFDPAATTATTSFVNGGWVTRVPSSGLAGNTFMAGLSYQLSSNLAGGLNPVSWSGTFISDTPGVTLQWKWAAAVYSRFSSDYTSLGVKPVDDNYASQYQNSDHAGTPENYKAYVVGGARGGGGSNYTGSYSGTLTVTPCVRSN